MTDKEKGNVIDWLTEIVENPEQWAIFYSESEQKLLAENAIALLNGNHDQVCCKDCRYVGFKWKDGKYFCNAPAEVWGGTHDPDFYCKGGERRKEHE